MTQDVTNFYQCSCGTVFHEKHECSAMTRCICCNNLVDPYYSCHLFNVAHHGTEQRQAQREYARTQELSTHGY